MIRVCLGASVVVFLSLAPIAEAQSILRITTEWEAASVDLDDTGRADVQLHVKATVADTVCAAEQTYTVSLSPGTFPKWAGASLVPSQATFKVPAGPHPGTVTLDDQQVALDIAWDLDGAPRMDAVQAYVIQLSPDHVVRSGGPCFPDPSIETQEPGPLRVALADRPVEAEEQDCLAEPLQEKCVSTSVPPEPAAAVGPLVALLVFALATLVHRRRA